MKHLIAIIFLNSCGQVYAQQSDFFTRDLDSLIAAYIVEKELPSAAVGVVYEDAVLYEKRILNNKHTTVPTRKDEKAIYNIASVAKPFVATAIMMLVQEGKIDLKSPITQYLPYFDIDSRFKDKITVEHLLTHSSGLPSTSSPNDYQYVKVDTTADALDQHIRSLSSLKLAFKPGKKYAYSNVGYEVLGQIIAEVSNMPFEEYMNIHLFGPLHMKRTSYLLEEFEPNEIAQPHDGFPAKVTDRFPYDRAFSPSGNLFTSIEDLNKWMIFNLNDGEYNDFKPLSAEHFALLTTPRINTDEGDFVALSWFLKDGLIFHDGLDLGYSALMILYKKQKFGITVLINHQEANCNELLNLIAKSIRF